MAAKAAIIAVPIEMFVQASRRSRGSLLKRAAQDIGIAMSPRPGRPPFRTSSSARSSPSSTDLEIVVRLERDEVADKERVGVADLADERFDEPIVRVEAARQDDRQEVHRNLATVKARTGTGPK